MSPAAVIDHYISSINTNYAYFSFTDFINAFFHFSGETFHIGQATEVIVILFALFAYTIWTQRSSLYTISGRTITAFRVGLLVFFAFLFIFVMGTPGTFLPVDPNLFPSFNSTRYYQYHLFFVFYYLATGIVLALVTTYFGTKGNFRNVFRSMRPAQTLFFAAIILAGIATGWQPAFQRKSSQQHLGDAVLGEPGIRWHLGRVRSACMAGEHVLERRKRHAVG